MYKRMTSVAVFAAMIFCLLSPFSVSADDIPTTSDYSSMISSIVDHYSLSDIHTTNYYVCTGINQDSVWHEAVVCLWDISNSKAYRIHHFLDNSRPDQFHSGDYGFFTDWALSQGWIGNTSLASFYFSGSSGILLTSFYSTDLSALATVDKFGANVREAKGLFLSDLPDSYSSSFSPSPDPTESSTGVFQLPDSWLNGGQTLPEVADPTFPASFSPDEAFGYIEDYTVELDDGTKSGIGFFWAVLTGCIDSLGIWTYVFFSLLMGLIAWILRGLL